MIYTITINPSMDLTSQVEELKIGRKNQSLSRHMNASGEGITISRLLRIMQIPTTATGFLGGQTGAFIEEELAAQDIPSAFVHTKNHPRINVSIFGKNSETQLIDPGKPVNLNEVNELMYYLSRIREGDFIILASTPLPQMPIDLYSRMVEIAVVNQAQFLPLIEARILRPFLSKKPLLIAPSFQDLATMFNQRVFEKEEAIQLGLQCLEEGAQNVLINMGIEGSIMITQDKKVFESKGPDASLISSAYTREALIAGFISNYVRTSDPEAAFTEAQACSNATYYHQLLPSFEEIQAEIKKTEVLPLA